MADDSREDLPAGHEPPNPAGTPPANAPAEWLSLRAADEAIHPSESPAANPDVDFERTDISFRGVLVTIIIFAGVMVVHQFLMSGLFEHDRRPLQKSQEAGFAPLTRAAALPQGPRLEQLDRLAGIKAPDVYRREADKEAILQSYGPTSEKGFVHVPIDWAIKQAAEQIPFKAAKPATPARDQGLIGAGESSSGRVFRGETSK